MIGDVKYDFHRASQPVSQPTWKFHTSKKFNNILKRAIAEHVSVWILMWCYLSCFPIIGKFSVSSSLFFPISICHALAFDQCDNDGWIVFVIEFLSLACFFYLSRQLHCHITSFYIIITANTSIYINGPSIFFCRFCFILLATSW